jgi:hypothetical protein
MPVSSGAAGCTSRRIAAISAFNVASCPALDLEGGEEGRRVHGAVSLAWARRWAA